jgi:hypothetical protein
VCVSALLDLIANIAPYETNIPAGCLLAIIYLAALRALRRSTLRHASAERFGGGRDSFLKIAGEIYCR